MGPGDLERIRMQQQAAIAAAGGMNANPTGFNPSMMAANAAMPNPSMPGEGFLGKLGNFGRRAGIGFNNAMGKLGQGMFPVDPSVAAHMTPEQIRELRSNSVMQMGLGMLGAASQGKGLGESLASGYFGAQEGMLGRQQMAYKLGANEREEKRTRERDVESDQRFDVETGLQERQIGQGDRRLGQADTAFDASRDDEMWNRDFKNRQLSEMSKYRLGMLGAQQGAGGTGYTQEGIDLLAHSTLRSPTLMNAYMSRSGRYNSNERRMVVERQAEILKENGITPSQIASIHANVKAQTGNIQVQTKSLQGLKAFDEVARANAERALQLFGKVSDSGVPLINMMTRGAEYGMGSEDVAELRQVLQNFQAETARIVAGHPQLLGATTDTARQEIERIVSGDMTKEQAERVIKRLLFEVDVRRAGFEEAIQESGTSMDRLGMPGQRFDQPGLGQPGAGAGASGSWAPPQQSAPGGVVNWEDLQ
jgi:hypothetical protein